MRKLFTIAVFSLIGFAVPMVFQACGKISDTNAPTPSSRTPVTKITLESTPGDYIGQGLSPTLTEKDGTIRATLNCSHASTGRCVGIHFEGDTGNWDFQFDVPLLEQLPIGRYVGAIRFPFNTSPLSASAFPGLNVTSDHRECNELTGSFEILEASLGQDQSTIEAFAVNFEQYCDNGPVLRGKIRYNSGI